MLTNEEKLKIKAEEAYRNEVRKSQNTDNKKSSFWTFLNSGLGIWFLSIRKIQDAAVFIGGNGIFYKSHNPSIKEIWQSFSDKIITDRWYYLFPYTDCLFC